MGFGNFLGGIGNAIGKGAGAISGGVGKLFGGAKQGFQQSTHNMKFAEKAHVLTTTMGQNMIILFQDDEKGIGPDQLESAIRAQKAQITNSNLLADQVTKSIFIPTFNRK